MAAERSLKNTGFKRKLYIGMRLRIGIVVAKITFVYKKT